MYIYIEIEMQQFIYPFRSLWQNEQMHLHAHVQPVHQVGAIEKRLTESRDNTQPLNSETAQVTIWTETRTFSCQLLVLGASLSCRSEGLGMIDANMVWQKFDNLTVVAEQISDIST